MSDIGNLAREIAEATAPNLPPEQDKNIAPDAGKRVVDDEPTSLVIAFVQGAAWWEYHQTKATIWQSDRRLAEEEAARREQNGTLGVLPDHTPSISPGAKQRKLDALGGYPNHRRKTMTLTKGQTDGMLEAAKPLMKWISDNCHPHCTATVEAGSVELTEGVAREISDEFIKD